MSVSVWINRLTKLFNLNTKSILSVISQTLVINKNIYKLPPRTWVVGFSAGISPLLKVQPQNCWMYVPGMQIKSFHSFSSPWQSTLIDYSKRLWSRKRQVELQLPSTLRGVVVATDKCARLHSDWHSRALWEKETHAWLVFVVTLNIMFPVFVVTLNMMFPSLQITKLPLWVVTSSS